MTVPTRLQAESSEAGETLIEVLLSSALMAIIVVAILGAIGTLMVSGVVHREQSDANASLVAAMERVKSPTLVRVPCATTTTSSYVTAAHNASPVLPSGWSIAITKVEYENYAASGVSFDTSCHETPTNTLTLQRITMQLTTADGRVSPQLSFVKGDY